MTEGIPVEGGGPPLMPGDHAIHPPGHDVPTDGLIASGISIGWLGHPRRLDGREEAEEAWQELFREPAWVEWMVEHSDVLYDPEVDMFLWVEDRDDVRSRHGRHLDYYIPATSFDDPETSRQVAREVIRGIYSKRAKKAGIPAPPPV